MTPGGHHGRDASSSASCTSTAPASRRCSPKCCGSEPIDRALVFTRTKHGADKVVRALDKAGLAAEAIHGNKSQGQRERVLAAFRAGKVRTLVATDIAARGIDVDGISHVVNYDLPNIPESYVHRIGRTARAGADGVAISFCDAEERAFLRDIEKLIRMSIPATDRRSDRRTARRAARERVADAQAASDAADAGRNRQRQPNGQHRSGNARRPGPQARQRRSAAATRGRSRRSSSNRGEQRTSIGNEPAAATRERPAAAHDGSIGVDRLHAAEAAHRGGIPGGDSAIARRARSLVDQGETAWRRKSCSNSTAP